MPQAKYQVRLLKIAEEDFTEIVSFIAVSNVDAANSFADQIKKKLELLSVNSHLGRISKDEEIRKMGYRYLIIQNYILFYTVEEKTIFVHRILHGARNYKSLL